MVQASAGNDPTQYTIATLRPYSIELDHDSLMVLVPSYTDPLKDTLFVTLSVLDTVTSGIVRSSEPVTYLAKNYIIKFNTFSYHDYHSLDSGWGLACNWDMSLYRPTSNQKWQVIATFTDSTKNTVLYTGVGSGFEIPFDNTPLFEDSAFLTLRIVEGDSVVVSSSPMPYRYSYPTEIQPAMARKSSALSMKNNTLTLEGIAGTKSVSLFSATGKLVQKWETNATTIDMGGVAKGAYFVSVVAGNVEHTEKIVVK